MIFFYKNALEIIFTTKMHMKQILLNSFQMIFTIKRHCTLLYNKNAFEMIFAINMHLKDFSNKKRSK